MKKNSTPFLDNPTFDSVHASGKQTGGVYITLKNGEYVKCECMKDGKKATIAFDLYTRACNHDVSPQAQKRLSARHKAYVHSEFAAAGYRGIIQCNFGGTIIYFDVLSKDAEEWFQNTLATLNDSASLVELSLTTADV